MTNLKIGDKAPAFKTINQNGETVELKDWSGKKIVLYFYPKDDTPGCTAEACSLRDNYNSLLAKGYTIYGISPDGTKKHLKFIEKYELPFDLLTDEIIIPDANGNYNFWYSSNENINVFSTSKTVAQLPGFLFYKFKTQANCQKWCDLKSGRVIPKS